MKKKFVSVAALAVLAAAMFFMSCASDGYPPYTPEKGAGNGGFDFPSNSYSADVELDGYLTDERWQADDVVCWVRGTIPMWKAALTAPLSTT